MVARVASIRSRFTRGAPDLETIPYVLEWRSDLKPLYLACGRYEIIRFPAWNGCLFTSTMNSTPALKPRKLLTLLAIGDLESKASGKRYVLRTVPWTDVAVQSKLSIWYTLPRKSLIVCSLPSLVAEVGIISGIEVFCAIACATSSAPSSWNARTWIGSSCCWNTASLSVTLLFGWFTSFVEASEFLWDYVHLNINLAPRYPR